MINTVEANDIVIWRDVISEKQYVSKILEVYRCEDSYDDEWQDRYIYRVTDIIDWLYEPKFICDYNIEEVYKRSDSDINE